MASDDEKRKRKALLAQAKQTEQAQEEAALSLPMAAIADLFDFVNDKLEDEGCDDTLRHSLAFLSNRGLAPEPVVAWLQKQGGYCDCEVIANAEDTWGDKVGSANA